MDIQFWIWLIIIVVTFIGRAMKKAKTPTPQAPQTDSDYDQTSDTKPMTFDELLREIQQSKTPPRPVEVKRQPVEFKQAPAKLPPAKSYGVDYDDDLEDEEKDLETIPTREDRSYEVYEQAKRDAFHRKSLEETMKLSDTDMKFSHFKGYDETSQSSIAKEVLKDFSDPQGFKKAFIMSEILKRKF